MERSWMDAALLAACLREEAAEILAQLPAARQAEEDHAPLDGVARSACRLLRTAENLGAYAALSSPAEGRPVCISGLTESFLMAAAGVCRHVMFRFSAPAKPLWALGDAHLFAVCLGNLILNAVQFGGERPRVEVRLRRCGTNVTITVCDNGKGMQPALLPQAFGPWCSQDPYGDGAPRPGLGLGLAVVHRYASRYGGALAAESTHGAGCRFTMSVPARESEGEFVRPDYAADRFSPVYTQLAPVCDLPF